MDEGKEASSAGLNNCIGLPSAESMVKHMCPDCQNKDTRMLDNIVTESTNPATGIVTMIVHHRHLILGPYNKETQHAWFSLEATRSLLKILMIPVVYSQQMVRFSTVTIFLLNIFGWCSKCRGEKQKT